MRYHARVMKEDDTWCATCVEVPGAHGQGSTRQEALNEMAQAIELLLEIEAEERMKDSVDQREEVLEVEV